MNVLKVDKDNKVILYEDNGRVFESKYIDLSTKKILSYLIPFILGFGISWFIYIYKGDIREDTSLFIANIEKVIEDRVEKDITGYKEEVNVYKPLRLIRVFEWVGGEKIDKVKLSDTIYGVMKRIGIEENDNLHRLVLETCAVETDFGRIVRQNGGPALSVYQILPSTFKYMMNKVKNTNEEQYKKLMLLYDVRKNDDYNFVYNLPFSTAICMLYYKDVVKDLDNKIKTREDRAKVWKQWYNTPGGKGTEAIYLKRTNQHI